MLETHDKKVESGLEIAQRRQSFNMLKRRSYGSLAHIFCIQAYLNLKLVTYYSLKLTLKVELGNAKKIVEFSSKF